MREGYLQEPAIKERRAKVSRTWNRHNINSVLVTKARKRSKELGIPCTLTKEDISIPEFCPVLGIALYIPENHHKGGPSNHSPTLDRLIPALGYTPQNTRVISWRANRIKNDATLLELQKIAQWLEAELGE